MHTRTCVAPDGRFAYGLHKPALAVANLRLNDFIERLGTTSEDQEIAEMLTTPDEIRTLQRRLYRKAKQEPGFRFYSLHDKVYRADILVQAYHLVRP